MNRSRHKPRLCPFCTRPLEAPRYRYTTHNPRWEELRYCDPCEAILYWGEWQGENYFQAYSYDANLIDYYTF